GAAPAGGHHQDLAAPGPPGSARTPQATRHGGFRRRPGPTFFSQRSPGGEASMTCLGGQHPWQTRVDGLPGARPAVLEQPLATCPACREQWAAVLRLQDGLRLLAAPLPPPGLAQRVTALALAERRAWLRRRRWLRAACALAAALFV